MNRGWIAAAGAGKLFLVIRIYSFIPLQTTLDYYRL